MDSQWALGAVLALVLMVKGSGAQACGQISFNPIDGAMETWPWLASLYVSSWKVCEGSLINTEWVLTAAQCFYGNSTNDFTVSLGSSSNSNQVSRNITEVIMHPNNNFFTHENDLALVKLASPVDFNNYIHPVCLAAEGSTFYTGIQSWATFWNIDWNTYILTLQEVEVKVMGNNECNCLYGEGTIKDDMFCASLVKKNNNINQGFRGGPLVTNKSSSWIQSGIFSFGESFYSSNCSAVYTSVTRYLSWINSTISGDQASFVLYTSSGNNTDLNFTCDAQLSDTCLAVFFDELITYEGQPPQSDGVSSTTSATQESISTTNELPTSSTKTTRYKAPSGPPFTCGQVPLNSGNSWGQGGPEGRLPWQASLNNPNGQFCGGSLINQQWVLTAAHCFESTDTEDLTVNMGQESQGDFSSCEISRIFIHPDYNNVTHDNDLALVKLASRVDFNDYIQPVCLAAEGSFFYDGTHSWVTGRVNFWSNESPYSTKALLTEYAPVVGNRQCGCLHNNAGFRITDNMICTGSLQRGREVYQGHSGGPLVSKHGSAWIQSGIANFGGNRVQPNLPQIYTGVSRFQNWIQTMVKINVGFVKFQSNGFDWDSFYICGDQSIFSGTPQLSFSLSLLLTLSPLLLSLYVFS